MFDASEQHLLRDHATFLTTRRERASDTVMLPDGRMVHIRGTRILAGSEVAGMVVVAEVVTTVRDATQTDFTERVLPQIAVATSQTSRIAGDLYRPHDTIAGGNSPAWARACNELRGALEHERPAVVMGETGAGKFTLVAEIFHATYPRGRSVSIDAAQLTEESSPTDIDSLLATQTEPTLLIVRNVDQASTDGVEQLDAFFSAISQRQRPTWFVATLSDSSLDSDLPFHTLLGHFEVAITVPPLRCRTEDLPAIVGSVLREIAPSRRVRLSPEAQRVVACYSWPRNVAQLREALVHALRQRPVGEIQKPDLPGYCQTTSRHTLTPLESAERDTIVAALQEHEGNKVAAAQHLGMSRSSLYRKFKTYGITA
jgi:transcriptional regulator of acetoin/glycerol metabolism